MKDNAKHFQRVHAVLALVPRVLYEGDDLAAVREDEKHGRALHTSGRWYPRRRFSNDGTTRATKMGIISFRESDSGLFRGEYHVY